AGAARLDLAPAAGGQRFDVNGDLVYLGAADQRRDLARLDLEVHHRAVADVGAAARQAVLVVAVGLPVVAPGPAPEGLCDGPALDDHRGDGLALLAAPLDLAGGLGPPPGHRHVGAKFKPHHKLLACE